MKTAGYKQIIESMTAYLRKQKAKTGKKGAGISHAQSVQRQELRIEFFKKGYNFSKREQQDQEQLK